MNQIANRLFVMLLLLASSAPLLHSQTRPPLRNGSLIEEFSFVIKDFKVDHQGEHNNLNIVVSFRYLPNVTKGYYPDFRWLAKDTETFLTNYPNEDDYWEIVNKQLSALLLKKYQSLAKITCEITIDPVGSVPYTRSSRVTRERTHAQVKPK